MKPLNQPALRFAGFADAWEQRKLGDIFDFYRGRGLSWVDISEDGVNACILYGNLYTDYGMTIYSVKYKTNLPKEACFLSKIGDVLIPASDTTPTGLARASSLNLDDVLLGGDINILRPKKGHGDFLSFTINANKAELIKRIKGSTVRHLNGSDLKEISLVISIDLKEQTAIGNFFRQLDEAIAAHQRKLEKIKELKNSLLHKMFPKDGEAVPELRLSGFTDAWEQRKLGELGSVAMNKRIFKEQTTTIGDVPFYKIGTFGGIADAYISRELFEEYRNKYPYPEKGDILLSASGSIGKAVEYQGNDEYFQDSNIVWLKHNNLNNSFLKYFYSIVKWEGIEGSTIKRLYNDNILKTKILLPSLQEQTAIGNFFRQLDTVIEAYQQKSNQLHTLKTALLGKMFV